MRLTITQTDPKDVENLNLFCTQLNYTGTFNGQPETKMEFLKRKVVDYLRQQINVARVKATAIEDVPVE